MKSNKWKTYTLFIVLCEAVGAISALLTRKGMEIYTATAVQPPLSPPPLVFPIVWTILFALMGIGAARVYLAPVSVERGRGLAVFVLQLVLNFAWTMTFFGAHAYGWAFVCIVALWLAIFWMITSFARTDKVAGYLQLPYIIWVSFASYLNLGVWMLN